MRSAGSKGSAQPASAQHAVRRRDPPVERILVVEPVFVALAQLRRGRRLPYQAVAPAVRQSVGGSGDVCFILENG